MEQERSYGMKIEMVREICHKIAADYGFKIDFPINDNGRLKTTLGRVSYEAVGDRVTNITRMEFSRQFLELGDESAIMDVIRHELAHAFVFMETGRKHGHDYVFKAMCLRIGTRLDMAESDVGYRVPAEEINKYTIRCSECGKIVGYRQRMCPVVKTPENFQSSCCHADLVVTQNF